MPVTKMSKSVVALTCLVSFIVVAYSQCDIPTSVVCEYPELIHLCQMTEECSSFNKGPVDRVYKTKPIPEDLPGDFKDSAPLVDLALYYESKCPFCQMFFSVQLGPVYQMISSIMNVTLVPYGNARETKVGDRYKFTCQHGGSECQGNIIETCTINIVNDISKYLPFLVCMEGDLTDSSPDEVAKECAKSHQVPLEHIMDCSTSSQGNAMEHQMALKTDALKPAHKYVPWIVVNGIHNKTIQDKGQRDLLQLICETYKGPKPKACH